MDKLSNFIALILEKAIIAFILALMGIYAAVSFIYSLRLPKISQAVLEDDSLLFLNKKGGCLFKITRSSKYNITFLDNLIIFGYFGCALENDCFYFRISKVTRKELEARLKKSTWLYEANSYRL